MKRTHPAFTMLELTIVLIVVGILAALVVPRMERDRTQEAIDNVLSAIRYTKHLALMDNKHEFNNASWQRKFWQIQFESCANDTGMFYTIGSDEDEGGDIDRDEAAVDPVSGQPYFWRNTSKCTNGGDGTASPNIFLTKLYGVTSVSGSGGCNNIQYIGFDHLGRPHINFSTSTDPSSDNLMYDPCIFTFTVKGSDSFQIRIEPETGFISVVGKEDL